MDSNDDLYYSYEASSTRYFFYQGLNDINIFVEDSGKEYEYETIFIKLLGDDFKIKTIFGVGGKLELIKRFNEFGIRDDSCNVNNIYLADGDFDRYIYSPDMIKNKHFIYLNTYNIENYFIDEDASLMFVKGQLKLSNEQIKNKVDFQKWKSKIVSQAEKLFMCYCYVKKYHPTVENVNRSPYLFIDSKTGFEKEDSLNSYWKMILELDSEENIKSKIKEIKISYESVNGNNYYNLICGKFLFTSLCAYLRNIISKKFSYNGFRWHLICNFDISQLYYVKNKILSLYN